MYIEIGLEASLLFVVVSAHQTLFVRNSSNGLNECLELENRLLALHSLLYALNQPAVAHGHTTVLKREPNRMNSIAFHLAARRAYYREMHVVFALLIGVR